MRASSSFIRALAAVCAVVALFAFGGSTAFAQSSPAPSGVSTASASGSASAKAVPTKAPGPPASYYASYGLMAIGGLTLVMILGMYLFQAPGFRRSSKSNTE